MVEFCTGCGTSLPRGDLSFKGGKLFTSHDYTCPSCNQPANPSKEEVVEAPEASAERDLFFKNGEARQE